ncbi:MAG: lactate utilization protein [Parcubacteria group bacterium]
MNYETLANKDTVEKTINSLKERNIEAFVVNSGSEALEKIKELVSEGASIMNGASKTLEQIGFVDYLKSGEHKWNNLHEAILAENDKEKQAELRKKSVLSDYYLGSVHALAETGEIVIASNTGSQLPHIVFTSHDVIFVASTKKIVPTLTDAIDRLYKHVIPLEDERMMGVYHVHTSPNKILIINGENPMMGRKVRLILVNEDLGY